MIDVVQVLTQQADYQTARKYWNKLKERLDKEGSESVTNCLRLKLPAAGCQKYQKDLEGTAQSVRRYDIGIRLKNKMAVPNLRDLSPEETDGF